MGRICSACKCNHKLNKCARFCNGFVSDKKRVLSPVNLAISFVSSLRTPGKLLGVTTLVLTNTSKSDLTTSWRNFILFKRHSISWRISFCLMCSWKRPHCLVSWWTTEQELHLSKKKKVSGSDLQSCDGLTVSLVIYSYTHVTVTPTQEIHIGQWTHPLSWIFRRQKLLSLYSEYICKIPRANV